MRIQLCPALMDWIVFLVLFAVMYSAGERSLSGAERVWLASIPSVTYTVVSLLVGLVLTRRNARRLLLLSTLLMTAFGAASLLRADFAAQMLCLGLLGASQAVFFNAFQTFMRGETVPGGLAVTVARYTLAWSAGSSFGFLSSGAAYQLGMIALAGVDAAVGLAVLGLLLRHRPRHHDEASADEHVEQPGDGARAVNPAYVAVGWCMIFSVAFVQRPLQSLFPAACGQLGVSADVAGFVLFLHMLVQGVSGYAMRCFTNWRYRRTPIVLVHTAAALMFGCAVRYPSFLMSSAAIVLFGSYAGFVYFSSVYYSSNSGRRSYNIGVNECAVGMGCLAGPFVSQWWATCTGSDRAMYGVAAVALLASMVVQLLLASRRLTITGATSDAGASCP